MGEENTKDGRIERRLALIICLILTLVGILLLGILDWSSSGSSHFHLRELAEDVCRELAISLIVAGTAGTWFELAVHSRTFRSAFATFQTVVNELKTNVGTVSEELGEKVAVASEQLGALQTTITETQRNFEKDSRVLLSTQKIGIIDVFEDRNDDQWKEAAANAVRNTKGTVRLLGVALMTVCGKVPAAERGIKKEIFDLMRSDRIAGLQILYANPWGEGLQWRAKYECPGEELEQTRTFKDTIDAIKAVDEMTKSGRVSIKVYDDPIICFLLITDEVLFVEHYNAVDRGGGFTIISAAKGTPVYSNYSQHFNALFRSSISPDMDKIRAAFHKIH